MNVTVSPRCCCCLCHVGLDVWDTSLHKDVNECYSESTLLLLLCRVGLDAWDTSLHKDVNECYSESTLLLLCVSCLSLIHI